MVWRQAARFVVLQAVTDPIGFFGAQRFPDVLAVPREMLEVDELAVRLLPWRSISQ
jgi:hypothetical protein